MAAKATAVAGCSLGRATLSEAFSTEAVIPGGGLSRTSEWVKWFDYVEANDEGHSQIHLHGFSLLLPLIQRPVSSLLDGSLLQRFQLTRWTLRDKRHRGNKKKGKQKERLQSHHPENKANRKTKLFAAAASFRRRTTSANRLTCVKMRAAVRDYLCAITTWLMYDQI